MALGWLSYVPKPSRSQHTSGCHLPALAGWFFTQCFSSDHPQIAASLPERDGKGRQLPALPSREEVRLSRIPLTALPTSSWGPCPARDPMATQVQQRPGRREPHCLMGQDLERGWRDSVCRLASWLKQAGASRASAWASRPPGRVLDLLQGSLVKPLPLPAAN